MTIKEIWTEFVTTVKEAASASWKQIRNVAKTTLRLLKTALIDLITNLSAWLWSLISGVLVVVYEFAKVLAVALTSAIKATLGILVDYIINWIKKW